MTENLTAKSSVSIPNIQLGMLELWVESLVETKQMLSAMFGFEPSAIETVASPDEQSVCLTCGNVDLMLRQGNIETNRVALHVSRHGDSFVDAVLVCDAVDSVVDRALAHGVKVSYAGGQPTIDVLGDGMILHSLRDREVSTRKLPSGRNRSPQMRGIDHITYCLPSGTIDRVARIYREVFALENVPISKERVKNPGDFTGKGGGMRSAVLRSSLGFTVVLTEPQSATGPGQIQRFLLAHGGPGLQHVAVAYDDIVAAARWLGSNGVRFLPIPEEHLQLSHQRLAGRALPWSELRRQQILVEADETGLLFQLFTRPISDRGSFFVELIQREGATGFGASNVRALFAAVDAAVDDAVDPLWRSSREEFRGDQPAWIDELVHNARSNISFYRDHLAAFAGSGSAILPTFDKSMTVGYGRFPLSVSVSYGTHRVLATSGTSGHRLYVSFDSGEWNRTANWLEKVGKRVGLTPNDVLLNTHCYGMWVGGPALDLLANRAGAGLVALGPIGASTVLELLAEGVGTAISATPSYLRRLVEAALLTGVNLKKTALRFGFIGAEPAEESLRRKLLAHLPEGFQWIELYGLTETGGPAVAFAPDPAVAELQLNTGDFWAEVLDLTADHPVPMRDVGELTITTRRTDGCTPLVRYRTRDLVRAVAGEPESPTRMSRILGRVDESLKIGGVLLYPTAVAEIMSELMPVTAEWRACVSYLEADAQLLIEAEAPEDLCRAVERLFEDRIGLSLSVIAAKPGTFARSLQKTQRVLIDSSTTNVRPSTRLG